MGGHVASLPLTHHFLLFSQSQDKSYCLSPLTKGLVKESCKNGPGEMLMHGRTHSPFTVPHPAFITKSGYLN